MRRVDAGRVLLWAAVALAVVGAAVSAAPGVGVAQSEGAGRFADDDGSVHEVALEALGARGVLAGFDCGEGLICPDEPLRRWEMAVWLVRVLDGADPGAAGVSRFADVDAELWWAPFVDRLHELGVTAGCATEPERFCPLDDVTRAQMATFLGRAFQIESAPSAGFTDVGSGPHAASIHALAAAGITGGCSREPLRYCPADPVTRAQMATLVARALGLIDLPASARFIAVDAARLHVCGLRADGTIACWGDNLYGQADAPDGEFVTVSAGDGHSCGVRVDGTVACWGYNEWGQAEPPGGEFVNVSAGGYGAAHSCGVRVDRTVACWGNNQWGQAEAPGGEFVTVSAGGSHSCGVRVDGTVACWGSGTAGSPPPPGRFGAVSAGTHSCGVRVDGTVACWVPSTVEYSGLLTAAPTGRFSVVSAGDDHSCGVRVDGTVACWGSEYWQRATLDGEFKSVSVDGDRSCGVRVGGTVVCWGRHYHSQVEVPVGQFTALSAGDAHACGLRGDGTVACWGHSDLGQASAPPGKFKAVSAGYGVSCGLRVDGTVSCWGGGKYWATRPGMAGHGKFKAVATGARYWCGVLLDGTVDCRELTGPQGFVPSPERFDDVAAGLVFACGLRTDRRIVCWTALQEDRLSEDTLEDPPHGRFDGVSVGFRHGCGLRSEGTVACWGDNSHGQADAPEGRFIAVSAGHEHSCGLRADAAVECWGDNSFGQTDVPAGQFKAVGAGVGYSCGVNISGVIQCWGSRDIPAPVGVRRVAGPLLADPDSCRPFYGTKRTGVGFPLASQVPSLTGVLRVAVLFVDFPGAEASTRYLPKRHADHLYAERYIESASYGALRVEFVPLNQWLRAEHGYQFYLAPLIFAGPIPVGRSIDVEAVRLADPLFDFSGMDALMIVLPDAHFRGGNAGGYVETEEGWVSTLRINTLPGAGPPQGGRVEAHELAHNLGLADLYPFRGDFAPDPPADGKEWRRVELGLMGLASWVRTDRSAVGRIDAAEMLAWSRWQLGWLSDEQIRCVREPAATVELSPVASPGDGIAMAAVPLSWTELIVVESRRRIGFDEQAAWGDGAVVVYTVDGLIDSGDRPIRLAGDAGRGYSSRSPILTVGESVVVRGYTITVLADDGDTHTVSITRTGFS